VRNSRGRLLLPAVLLVAVTGCSFQGSISDAESPASSHARTTTGTSSSPSSSAAPVTSGSSSSGTVPAGSPTSNGSASPGRCHTADLAASLQPGSPGAGQRFATLVLRNTSGRTCTVEGYGGIGLVAASGAPLPTHQDRVLPAPGTVALRPGGSARSQLHWSAVPGAGDATSGDCQPTAAALQVIPPDETSPLSVAWTQGPVCEGGTIQQQPYAAG
jgi:hypothetical protein